MIRLLVFISLLGLYITYSLVVYSKGTENSINFAGKQQQVSQGKELFQRHNCISCHQLYGLGGYLGPELTTAWSDKKRGEGYMRSFLKYGGPRMPDFHFKEEEINAIISYLAYVDSTAITYKDQ